VSSRVSFGLTEELVEIEGEAGKERSGQALVGLARQLGDPRERAVLGAPVDLHERQLGIDDPLLADPDAGVETPVSLRQKLPCARHERMADLHPKP